MKAKEDWERERTEDVDAGGDEDVQQDDAASIDRPRFGREIKLGLALIGVLLMALVVVVYFRMVGQPTESTDAAPATGEGQPKGASSGGSGLAPARPVSAGVQPAVVSAKSGPELPGLPPRSEASPWTTTTDSPQASGAPAPRAPAFGLAPAGETMVGDRYSSPWASDPKTLPPAAPQSAGVGLGLVG